MNTFSGRPRVPHYLVHRPRLSELLDHAAGLKIVHGPSGAGRTVAVADWAARVENSTSGVWITVDDAATTRLAFWSAFAELLMDAQIMPAASTLQEGLRTLEAEDDPRRTVLRACAQFTADITIVVDDFWRVTDELVAHDLLSIVKAHPRVSIIAITRSVGEIISTEDEIAIAPVVIGPDALAFTQAEVAEALRIAGVSDLDEELAGTLVRVVDGHPLLVRGVIQAINRGDVGFGPGSLQGTVRYLGKRLLKELVLPQTTARGDGARALYCSVPAVLTEALVHQLTGLDGAALLARFEREGLGVWSGGTVEPVFTLAPLVRTAWKAELEATQPEVVAGLSLAAAEWCVSYDRPVLALRHALEAEAYDLASDIVIQSWAEMIRTHRTVVLELLDDLPTRVLLMQPVLAMWLALVHNAIGVHRARALELLGIATQAASRPREGLSHARRAINFLIESSALRVLGRGDQAVAAADRGRAIVEGLREQDKAELGTFLPVLLNNAGLTYLSNGMLVPARDMFEAALGSAPLSRELRALHSRCLLAGLHAIRGAMDEAAEIVQSVMSQEWPERLLTSYHGALLQVAEAHLALERFDYAAALRNVEAMAPHMATIEHWPLFAQIEAMARFGQGELHLAVTGLESRVLSPSRPASPAALAVLDAHRALLQLAAGAAEKAESLLEPHPKDSAPIAVCRARLELLRGRPENALQVLLGAQDIEIFSVRLTSEIALLRAVATLRLGRTDVSLAAIDSAVALMSEHGLRLPVLLLPASDREALLLSLEQRGPSRSRDFLQGLADRTSLVPDAVTVVNLSDRELIVLRALAAGENLAAIAASLFVSKNTVKSQVQSIYRKLGVGTRDEALLTAAELHLLA